MKIFAPFLLGIILSHSAWAQADMNYWTNEFKLDYINQGIEFKIQNKRLLDETGQQNGKYSRPVAIQFFLERQLKIDDSLEMVIIFDLIEGERDVYDSLIYLSNLSKVNIPFRKLILDTFERNQTMTETVSHTHYVSVTVQGETQTATCADGTTVTASIPSRTVSENQSFPESFTHKRSIAVTQVKAYVSFDAEQIKNLLNSKSVRFQIDTDKQSLTFDFNFSTLYSLKRFLRRYSK